MTKELSIAELMQQAAELEDQSKNVASSNFERKTPPAGMAFARLIEYVEFGKQAQPDYQGKKKQPADVIRLTFELYGKNHIEEYEHEGVQKLRANLISFYVTKKLDEKARFRKLFNAMTYGRDSIKHMAQMLGESFKVNVKHSVPEKEGDPVYAKIIDKDGVYIYAPMREISDDDGNVELVKVKVRDNIAPLRLFLWDNPTKGTWDSLYIDGERTVKTEDGKEKKVSNNYLQERILGATNFRGSTLEALLGDVGDLPTTEEGSDMDLNDETGELPPFEPEKPKEAPKKQKATKPAAEQSKPVQRQQQTKQAALEEADDDLAALGLEAA